MGNLNGVKLHWVSGRLYLFFQWIWTRYVYFYVSLWKIMPTCVKNLHVKSVIWCYMSHTQTSSCWNGVKNPDFGGRFLVSGGIYFSWTEIDVDISSQYSLKNKCLPPTQCSFTLSKFPTYFMNIEIETVVGACELHRFNSVFQRPCFSFKLTTVISLSGVQLSGFIHLSHVKTAIFDIVFGGFHIVFFFVFIENTNNWMFQVCNQKSQTKISFWRFIN